jgi:ornithine cyclodeaminase
LPVRILPLDEIRRVLRYPEVIDRMRDAMIAYSRGECDMPMPMHLEIPAREAEVHIKSSYRRGGRYFALKIAATFPGNPARGLPAGNGMMLLSSAETGDPVAFLADGGHLTDVRTAAVAAMVARELGRRDRTIGILGTGIQARLSAALHAALLAPERIVIWGRSREHAEACARDVRAGAPGGCDVAVAESPAEVARVCRLIVTCTASRGPLLYNPEIEPGTHISAIGADTPAKQELEAAILRRAALVLADSRPQCEKLGELQHAPDLWGRAVEIGDFCESPRPLAPGGVTVCDFTGLGVEDLYIAEYVYGKVTGAA